MTQPTIEQEFDVKLLQELASCLHLEVPITWHWDKLKALCAINAAFERYHAALTAQAGDGNRLPLEEVPEGWRLEQLAFYHNSENQPKWICDLYNEKANRLVSTNCHDTSAEALRAAIAAAKGE